mmetsp:Transcript_3193/g.12257  ORF Transcript_3193/g.12257 Transcript_3193/m.12257 type:complete len:208 (+) Transcript_3193:482-1105(+)
MLGPSGELLSSVATLLERDEVQQVQVRMERQHRVHRQIGRALRNRTAHPPEVIRGQVQGTGRQQGVGRRNLQDGAVANCREARIQEKVRGQIWLHVGSRRSAALCQRCSGKMSHRLVRRRNILNLQWLPQAVPHQQLHKVLRDAVVDVHEDLGRTPREQDDIAQHLAPRRQKGRRSCSRGRCGDQRHVLRAEPLQETSGPVPRHAEH